MNHTILDLWLAHNAGLRTFAHMSKSGPFQLLVSESRAMSNQAFKRLFPKGRHPCLWLDLPIFSQSAASKVYLRVGVDSGSGSIL